MSKSPKRLPLKQVLTLGELLGGNVTIYGPKRVVVDSTRHERPDEDGGGHTSTDNLLWHTSRRIPTWRDILLTVVIIAAFAFYKVFSTSPSVSILPGTIHFSARILPFKLLPIHHVVRELLLFQILL